MTLRSVARSRTTGNLENGSSRIGCSRLSINAEQAIRALPLISIAHDPHTSSRQFESYVTGVVAFPSRVDGSAAISINAEMTFIFRQQGTENSSQHAFAEGVCRPLILLM